MRLLVVLTWIQGYNRHYISSNGLLEMNTEVTNMLPSATILAPPKPWLDSWQAARIQAIDVFMKTRQIGKLWQMLSKSADEALIESFKPFQAQACLIAAGSYGRRELLPYSDIDILVLTNGTAPPGLQEWIANLWSSGLKIGHGVHTPESAIRAMQEDIITFHSLLHARVIAGDKTLYNRFMRRWRQLLRQHGVMHFIDQLLQARQSRHRRFGDSRFLLEPQAKEGKGAARDAELIASLYHLAFGARDVSSVRAGALIPKSSAMGLKKARHFFARIRAMLHLRNQRASEHLSFDAQLYLANQLGYRGKTAEMKAQRFMAEYFHHTRIVTARMRECCVLLDRFGKRTPPFRLADLPTSLPEGLEWRDGRIALLHTDIHKHTASEIMAAFMASAVLRRDIHPNSYAFLEENHAKLAAFFAKDTTIGQLLCEVLLSEHASVILRKLQDANMLAAMLPEFAAVTGQMQYDGYHTLTVDAHIIKVVENLHALTSGMMQKIAPLASKTAQDIVHHKALYVAALCHDLAKGTGGSHAEKGQEIAENIAQKMGLSHAGIKLCGWLVSQHLLLNETAFKRDLHDSETIQTFVEKVQSPERLRLLFLLTIADMMAVGPNIWNGWKSTMIDALFSKSMQQMGVSLQPDMGILAVDARPLSEEERKLMEKEKLLASWQVNPHQAMTTLTLTLDYEQDMLRHAAGVLAYIGANIVSARTIMLEQNICRVIFALQDGHAHAFTEEGRLRKLVALMRESKSNPEMFETGLRKRGYWRSIRRSVGITPEIFFDQHSSSTATIIEVNANDRPGLLYDILSAFLKGHVHVSHAYIATYGQKVVDVFYVRDKFGFKLMQPPIIQQLHALLYQAVLGEETHG